MNFRNFLVPTVIGLGLYAQANNLNLATNTTALLELALSAVQQEEIAILQRQVTRLNCTVYGTPWGYGEPYAFAAPIAAPIPQAAPFATNYSCCV
jgi:hypothetical protein